MRLVRISLILAAFLALWRYKVDIMKVIGACAAAGLMWQFAFKPVLG